MTQGKESIRASAVRLETVPVMLSASGLGNGLPGQLLAIAASLGMTLLTLTASVS
jgi:hypothetical protein